MSNLMTFQCHICLQTFEAVFVNNHEGWRAKTELCKHTRISPRFGIRFHIPLEDDTPDNPNQLFKRRHRES